MLPFEIGTSVESGVQGFHRGDMMVQDFLPLLRSSCSCPYVYSMFQLIFLLWCAGNYNLGQQHPMRPHRVRLTHSLVEGYGLSKYMSVHRPIRCTAGDLELFHADGKLENCFAPILVGEGTGL